MKKEKLIILFLTAILIEVIVFNITSYYAFFGAKSAIVYDNPNLSYDDDKFVYLELNDINAKVCTIKLDLKPLDNYSKVVEYKVFYTDDTSSAFRGLKSKMYVEKDERSKYTPLFLSGETKNLMVAVDKNVYYHEMFNSIIVNAKIPIHFNLLRFVLLYGIMVLVYALKKSKAFNSVYSITNYRQETILLGVLLCFMMITSVLNTYCSEEGENYFTTDIGIYNKEFVDALYNKQLYLLEDPSERFMQLEDPYDDLTRARNVTRGEDYKWDTAYYNGHQYIYFGILPALLVFLPFHIITHQYLKASFVVFMFSIFVLILLKEILLIVINRYFKDVPFKNVFYSLIALLSGSLILYANGIPRVYELAIVSGLFFALLGILFVLKSLENDNKKYRSLFLGTLFLALSVACRPTDLFISLIILPYIISLFINLLKTKDRKGLLKLILSVGIPYMTVGILLMIYNYVRFNSPFEFGASYQLTLNNMKELKSGIYSIPAGLFTNLFGIPRFIMEFPFIDNNNELLSFYGYYYIENMVGGLFMIAPICFSCFYIFKANKNNESKELKILTWVLLIVSILIAMISVSKAGSNERYLIDYAWALIIDGILIFSVLYNQYKSKEAKKILQKILAITTIFSFVFAISAGIRSEKSYFSNNAPQQYYKLRYTICFWE